MKKHISEQFIGLRESQGKFKKHSELSENENTTKVLDVAKVVLKGKLNSTKMKISNQKSKFSSQESRKRAK